MSRDLAFPALDETRRELKSLLAKVPDDTPMKSLGKYLTAEDLDRMKTLNTRLDELEAMRRAAEAAKSGGAGEAGHGDFGGSTTYGARSGNPGSQWAVKAAASMATAAKQHGVKALTSGSIDVPAMISADVVSLPTRADRLIDLLINRESITTNEFEFLRQTVRQNNAAPVPDHGQKPESVYTIAPVEGRARVIAHLSEPLPERFFADHRSIVQWLEGEMFNGVLDALEGQIVSGNGVGENMTGVMNTSGIAHVPYAVSAVATLRRARTRFQLAHETPTGWVLHPSDAETLDLLQTADGEFLGGLSLTNIMGDIPHVISTSIPAGTALLGDWRQVRLFIREGTRLDADRSGALFKTNEVVLRAEGRFGIGVLRPQAFATVDLTA